MKEQSMNQVLNVNFTKEVNGRTYSFTVPMGAPLGEAYDACHEVLMLITKSAQEAAEKAKPVEPVATPVVLPTEGETNG